MKLLRWAKMKDGSWETTLSAVSYGYSIQPNFSPLSPMVALYSFWRLPHSTGPHHEFIDFYRSVKAAKRGAERKEAGLLA